MKIRPNISNDNKIRLKPMLLKLALKEISGSENTVKHWICSKKLLTANRQDAERLTKKKQLKKKSDGHFKTQNLLKAIKGGRG